MQDLKNRLISEYNSGNPIITDEEYDNLVATNSGLESLGEAGNRKHFRRLGSIRKIYEGEDEVPANMQNAVKSPKLDGLALSLTYVDGVLTYAATRGDGTKGTDVTEKILAAQKSLSIPVNIRSKNLTIQQIDGEVVCPNTYDNPRNIVSGAVTHLLDPNEFKSRAEEYGFTFVAYGNSAEHSLYTESMEALDCAGFITVLSLPKEHGFPTDGYVLRLNSNTEVENLGFTGNYRNGLLAVKVRKAGIETVLLDVIWQVSPKGNVTPVAILEPVYIDGALVSKATLNNPEFLSLLIADTGLGIGSTVSVIRAGEIIPKIVGVISKGDEITIPTTCPCCNSELESNGAFLVCTNKVDCSSQVAKLAQTFFSTLGVKGFGEKTAEKFNKLPVEIIQLPESHFIDIIGLTLGKKLFDQIEKLKSEPVAQAVLLQAMSIPMVGKQASELLPKLSEWNEETISAALGSKKALTEKVLYWYNNTFKDIWNGVWPLETTFEKLSNKPTAKIAVSVTGAIEGYTRTKLTAMLAGLGVEILSSVSKKTSYLICDIEAKSSSYTKAESLGIPILTLKQFLEKLQHDNYI